MAWASRCSLVPPYAQAAVDSCLDFRPGEVAPAIEAFYIQQIAGLGFTMQGWQGLVPMSAVVWGYRRLPTSWARPGTRDRASRDLVLLGSAWICHTPFFNLEGKSRYLCTEVAGYLTAYTNSALVGLWLRAELEPKSQCTRASCGGWHIGVIGVFLVPRNCQGLTVYDAIRRWAWDKSACGSSAE